MLSPLYGFLAAALGSALADLFSGYALYAPATFVIKGLMALVAYYGYHFLRKKFKRFPSALLSGVAAELVMVLGYFVFEGCLYGFIPSLINTPPNGMQGVAGLVIGILLLNLFKKNKFITFTY